MIEHDIILVKPKAKVQALVPVTNYHNGPARFPDIMSQHDLDVWLHTCSFQRGDYVTYNRSPLANYFTAAGVYTIEEMCSDFFKMKNNSYAPYHPLLVLLKPLPYSDGTTNMRGMEWRDVHWLRRCTDMEVEQTIKPYLEKAKGQ